MVLESTRRESESVLFKWSAVVCAVLAAALWVGPYLLRVDVYADDAAQHLFWMYRFVDPSLFPNDLSVVYFGDVSAAPWGYRSLYYLLSRFMDMQTASELVAVVLVLCSCWLAWKLGEACGDEQPALRGLLVVVSLLVLLPIKVTDLLTPLGLQRSFAMGLTLLCVWALVSRRYRWVGVSWLAGALFYPVIIVTLGLTGGVVFLLDIIRDRRLPPAAIWNMVLGVAAVGIALLSSELPPGIGPTVTGAQAMTMPEFFAGGRLGMFGMNFSATWFADHLIALGWPRPMVLLMVVALGVVLVFRRRAIPPAGWVMVAVGLSVWFISRQVLFQLYLPNRHSRWSVACFAVVLFSAVAYMVVQSLRRRLAASNQGALRGLTWGVALVAPLLVGAALLPEARRVHNKPVDLDMERAYAFLAGLPADTLVAAHPDVVDFVPLRSHRSVLVSSEMSLPFMLGYYNQLKPRIEASLRAAYATSVEEMDAALADFGVDVMLTDASVWEKPDYYKPFDKLTAELRGHGDRQGFVLQAPPAERVLFRSGDVYVVRVGQGH